MRIFAPQKHNFSDPIMKTGKQYLPVHKLLILVLFSIALSACHRHDAKHYLRKGTEEFRGKNMNAALEQFNKAIEEDPKSVDAFYYRALVYDKLNKPAQAMADLNTVIRMNSRYRFAHTNKGGLYLKMGKQKEALDEFALELMSYPSELEVYHTRSKIYYDNKQFDLAIKDNTAALKIDSKNLFSLFNRALSYTELGDYQKASADFDAIIALEPSFKSAHASRAMLKIRMGKNADAIADFTEELKYYPKEAQLYEFRARAYFNAAKYDKAVADYSKAMELNPKNQENLLNRAFVYAKTRQNPQALADYNRILSQNPNQVTALINRGAVHQSMGNNDQAIADLKKAVDLGSAEASKILKSIFHVDYP